MYEFKNNGWNGRVPAGGKVNVGFEGSFAKGSVDSPLLMGKDFVGKFDKTRLIGNSYC